jgi:hypothetical protein
VANGLLYAAIIGLWGAYLVPKWISHHEELSEARSAERFSHAMRVLSRRGPDYPEARAAAAGRTPAGARVARPRDVGEPALGDRIGTVGSSSGRRRLAARRRRMLLVLLFSAVLSAALAPLSLLPWWPVAVMGAVVMLYTLHLRSQARQAAAVARRRSRLRRRSVERARRTQSAGVAATWRAMTGEGLAAEKADPAEGQRLAAQAAARAEAERLAADEARQTAEGGLAVEAVEAAAWRPAPVPLPTYVTKPKAVRHTRTIDLTSPGAWSSGRLVSPIEVEQDRAVESADVTDADKVHAGMVEAELTDAADPADPADAADPADGEAATEDLDVAGDDGREVEHRRAANE